MSRSSCLRSEKQSPLGGACALHRLRAKRQFSGTGLEVMSAPTDFTSAVTLQWTDFWPSAKGRKTSQSALHEIVGLAWYRLRQFLTASRSRISSGWAVCAATNASRALASSDLADNTTIPLNFAVRHQPRLALRSRSGTTGAMPL